MATDAAADGRQVVIMLALGIAAFMAVAVGMGIGSSGSIVAAVYLLGFLALPFTVLGVTVALIPTPSWWRMAGLVAAGHVLVAVALGLVGYMTIPAYEIVTDDPSRGTRQSLWEMHGEEMMHVQQYRQSDPERYALVENRIKRDRIRYLELWTLPALAGLFAIGGAALWLRRRAGGRITFQTGSAAPGR